MDYEDKVIYNTISLRGLVLHTFIAFTSKLPIDNLSNFVISYYIPEVVDFINNSGIKRGTMTVDKFKDLYGIKIDYISIFTFRDILRFQLQETRTRLDLIYYLVKIQKNIEADLSRFNFADELYIYLYSRFQRALKPCT